MKITQIAIVCYADNDNLKYEGYKYSEMLRNAGVSVWDMMAHDMPHGFYESGFGPLSEQDKMYLGEEVQKMILDGSVAKSSSECLDFIKDILSSVLLF